MVNDGSLGETAHQSDKGRAEKTLMDKRVSGVSPITRRILAINMLALAVLVVGLLYVGQYRQSLIDNEISSLTTQAELFAAALGEAAVGDRESANQYLVLNSARQIVRRFATTTGTHAQLISPDGNIITDSSLLSGPGGAVRVETLAPPEDGKELSKDVRDRFDHMLRNLLRDGDLDTGPRQSDNSKSTALALGGEKGNAVYAGDDNRLIVSAAVPVQRYKRVLGALRLAKDTRHIDEAVFEVRLDILKVFGAALLITVLLSIYLAGTIARPLRRLAVAAEHVRHGLSRQYKIPDLGRRKDEIGELSEALDEMTDALWQRMDAIERFAADVTHEIKNPLTSLRSAVETASHIDDPTQQIKLMDIILNDIKRLDRLISDISDASRLDSELSRAPMASVDLRGLLAMLIELHDATRDENGKQADVDVILETDIDGPLSVMGMEDRVVQVFRNLIGNAVSFSPEHGHITLRAERENGFITVCVDDDGPGIPVGNEQDIFDRFYKERPSSEKFGTHSGLGLSISKQIVDAHGGDIHAENRLSESGEVLGASFIVRLPVTD